MAVKSKSVSKAARSRAGVPTRARTILDALGEQIVRGEYAPGATLPVEQELANRFRSGRNAIREAVKMLTGRGLVRTERRAGTIVQPQSSWNLLDPSVLEWLVMDPKQRGRALAELTSLRAVVEPEIAMLAARNATTTETLRLFEAYEQMEAVAGDRERAVEADLDFHRRLAEAAHNMLLLSTMRCFEVLLRANFELVMAADGRYIRNLGGHRAVAEAVHAKAPDAARAAMNQLLEVNAGDISELVPDELAAPGTTRPA